MASGGRWFRVNTTWSQSEWLADLAPAGRLAWIELLGYVKAHGYNGRVRHVTRNIFSRRFSIPKEDVSAMLDAAQGDGALLLVDGDWVITGWVEHQGDPTAVERVRRSRERQKEPENVTRNRRNVTVLTATETETETDRRMDTSVSMSAQADAVREVFDYWRTKTGHTTATLTKDRRAKIKARLRVFSADQLRRAIDAAACDPFLQGDNDRAKRYDWPETIFRNDAAAERLILSTPHRNGASKAPIIRAAI
jgi:hypothetical protein